MPIHADMVASEWRVHGMAHACISRDPRAFSVHFVRFIGGKLRLEPMWWLPIGWQGTVHVPIHAHSAGPWLVCGILMQF